MRDERPTVLDSLKAMNGFDEVAVEQYFRSEITDLPNTRMMRALVFTLNRRRGESDEDAFKAAMGLTLGDLEGYFADPDGESGEPEGKD